MKFLSAALITLGFASTAAFAQQAHDHSTHDHAAPAVAPAETQQRIGDPWPLDTCVVSGEKLGSMGDPIILIHEGREVRFCCQGCVGTFKADPAKYLAKADEKIIELQKPFYPLDYCIVDTAQPLAGDPAQDTPAVIGNRLFVFCCPSCEKQVRAEPARFLATLDKAVVEKQAGDYPIDTCVISGQPLDSMGGPVDMVVAGHLVRLCCAGCKGKVEADPAGTLAKIHEARGGQDGHEDPANKSQAPEHGSETDHGQHGHH